MGEQSYGIDPAVATQIARDISEIQGMGVEVAIVIGGGNIFRGVAASARGMDRATADYMGMLATVINALALRDALEKEGAETRVQTAIWMQEIAEPFIRGRAMRHLEKEKGIYRAQMESSGKPANVIDKIVEGKLGSFYKQVVLPDQESIRDPKTTVKDVIAQASKALGAAVTVTRFARLKVGETNV